MSDFVGGLLAGLVIMMVIQLVLALAYHVLVQRPFQQVTIEDFLPKPTEGNS